MIRRNAAILPACTLVLGLIALFGYMATSVPAVNAGVAAAHGNARLSVPLDHTLDPAPTLAPAGGAWGDAGP